VLNVKYLHYFWKLVKKIYKYYGLLTKVIYTCFFVHFFTCFPVLSQNSRLSKHIIVVDGDSTLIDLSKSLYILSDSTDITEFEQISDNIKKLKFLPYSNYKKLYPRFVINKNYWARITFYNQSDRNHWVLYAGKGSKVRLFYPNKTGRYEKKVNGRLVKGSQRDIKNSIVESVYKFNVFLHPKKATTLYLNLQGKLYNPRFKLKLQSVQAYQKEEAYLITIESIFQGALWVILLYNIILFVIVKDRTYLYYSAYIFSYSIYYLSYREFLAEYPLTQAYLAIITQQTSMVFYFLFMKLFVEAKKLIPKWNNFIHYWLIVKAIFVSIVFIKIYLSLNLVDSELYLVIVVLTDVLLFIITCFILLSTKSVLARYFVTGSFFLMVGWFLSAFSFAGILQVDIDENYFSQGGLFLELVLFSVGLGYRERKNEQEKRLAQEENARILKEQNVTLERKVKERTLEITEKNEELMMQKEEILTQRDALQERGEELQFAYNQITDSVRYAQTIQNAILPFEKKIKRVFDDYFIIFYPKDIVSGDFYWFNSIEDGNHIKAVVSAIDCTGHGVPGAFMSMIGNTLLNETINEKRIFNPAEVLTRLHHKIRQDLRQAETNNSDGMDMVLCVIEQTSKQDYKLTFSGAKRPLYYIHEGELEQLKADRFSIGGEVYEDERERIFTNQEIILKKGDMFYLLTDGFGDTPGMDRKRFGSRNIKKMITAAKDLSMPDQKEAFEAALTNHMGDQEARDDVTFLGFKL